MQVWEEQHSRVDGGPRDLQTYISAPFLNTSASLHVSLGAFKSIPSVPYVGELSEVRSLPPPMRQAANPGTIYI